MTKRKAVQARNQKELSVGARPSQALATRPSQALRPVGALKAPSLPERWRGGKLLSEDLRSAMGRELVCRLMTAAADKRSDPDGRKHAAAVRNYANAVHNADTVLQKIISDTVRLFPDVAKEIDTLQLIAELTALFTVFRKLAAHGMDEAAMRIFKEQRDWTDRINRDAAENRKRRQQQQSREQ